LQTKAGDEWETEILSGSESSKTFDNAKDAPEALAISAIDRYGNASASALLTLRKAATPAKPKNKSATKD
jgi:hypothetical protein